MCVQAHKHMCGSTQTYLYIACICVHICRVCVCVCVCVFYICVQDLRHRTQLAEEEELSKLRNKRLQLKHKVLSCPPSSCASSTLRSSSAPPPLLSLVPLLSPPLSSCQFPALPEPVTHKHTHTRRGSCSWTRSSGSKANWITAASPILFPHRRAVT